MDAHEVKSQIEDVINYLSEIREFVKSSKIAVGVKSKIIEKLLNADTRLDNLNFDIEQDAFEQITSFPQNNVEDWKDLVIGCLPKGASVAMANDVEAALENIKSVY
jgi:hypothetical protein